MKHEHLQTPKSQRYTDGMEQRLQQALDAAFIRNVDYTDIKFRLSTAFSEERSNLPNLVGRPPHGDSFFEDFYAVDHLVPYSMVHVRTIAKKLPSTLKKLTHGDDPRIKAIAEAVSQMHDRWEPIVGQIEALKPFVVKGRTPSEIPADPRTLENTGTCSCCNRNIKLKDLKVVDHGFQVNGGRHGQCYGVNYHPIEVSTAGLENLLALNKRSRASKGEYLVKLQQGEIDTLHTMERRQMMVVKRGEDRFERLYQAAISNTTYEIETLDREIVFIEKRIADWVPRLLPDGQSHFAMPTSPTP